MNANETRGETAGDPSPALPTLPGASSAGAPEPTATTADLQTQTNRLTAETLRLIAEANELSARQLAEMKRVGEWLPRDLVAEAGRLAHVDKELRTREAAVPQSEKLYGEGVELKRQAEAQGQK